MTDSTEGAARATRRARVIAAIARYPDLAPAELADLKHWFRKEASALDVGLVASEPGLVGIWPQFRGDQLDPIDAVDTLRAVMLTFGTLALFVALLWQAF